MPEKAIQKSIETKTNPKDYVSAAQQFFTAYDAHDVDGMLALCSDGALGRYAPYGRESVVPIRGGIDVIWRAFPNAVPNFTCVSPAKMGFPASLLFCWRPRRDLNPCYRRERAMS